MFEILIDTGGTFTDGVLIDDEANIIVTKSETDSGDPASSILNCIDNLAREKEIKTEQLLADTNTILVGTTLAINCILEEKGAKCCLIHTHGFRDVYELGRTIPKTDIYNLKLFGPKILVPRYLRFGIEERLQYDGTEITPLSESDVRAAVENAKRLGVEVPIVCFLHSYINPAHEEQAAEIIREEFPNVVVSSQIVRRWIEYDRASTATLAAYVKPITNRFIGTLESQLKGAEFGGTLLFSTGLGTVATGELCLENPAHLIGSGLAMGALAGKYLAETAGFENVITCDTGGTSVDIGILKDRIISTTNESVIADQKNALQVMDIPTIGAGGGALAWIDDSGVLRVGPSSAGADPGPACYGKGGTLPTLTDANVLLGYIPADYFLGGDIPLDPALSEKAVGSVIAEPLAIDTTKAAHTISTLAEAITAERIFLAVVEKGYDPRDFVLVAAGGAGPVQAVAMARRLGMSQVYIPRHAAVFSALGGATADYGHILNRFYYRRDDQINIDDVLALYRSLDEEAVSVLERQGVKKGDMALGRGAEMRYFGQLRDIDVDLPEVKVGTTFVPEDFDDLLSRFHVRHDELYGWGDEKMTAMVAMLNVRAIGKRHTPPALEYPKGKADAAHALKRHRQVYFKDLGGFLDTPCFDGNLLAHGNAIRGPAIIEERRTTIVIPENCEIVVDRHDNYLATLN